jgi:hypothetical protein
MDKDITLKKFEKDTSNVLADALTNLAEGLTGIAASTKQELLLSIGYIFQKIRGGQFLDILLKEWGRFREKGRINDNYQYTEQHKVCLQELLDFLDKDSPDEIRFSVLKKIFLVAAMEELTNRESLLPQQYMKICRTLSSGEILVLNACYRLVKEEVSWEDTSEISHPGPWVTKIAELSGLVHLELVESYENELIKKKLLTDRLRSDRSGIKIKPHYRLTTLGYEICRYIDNYQE